MDKNTLSHTTWESKYHIVFAPKFRRQVIYGAIKADVVNILSTLCKRKGVEIIEVECCPRIIGVKGKDKKAIIDLLYQCYGLIE